MSLTGNSVDSIVVGVVHSNNRMLRGCVSNAMRWAMIYHVLPDVIVGGMDEMMKGVEGHYCGYGIISGGAPTSFIARTIQIEQLSPSD
jgi:hypothetical protein